MSLIVLPSNNISPLEGLSSPPNILNNVDFPEPDSPKTVINPVLGNSKSIPLKTKLS